MLNQFRLREPFELLMGRTWHRPPRRARPRRMRCGLSLFEALLVMLIAVPMLQQGVRLVEGYIRQQAGVQESRLLTQVVTAASTYALQKGLHDFISDEIGVTRIRALELVDFADLYKIVEIVAGNLRTSRGRNIEVIFHARDSETLAVLARAVAPTGAETTSYVPRGGEGIGLVGTIRANAPAWLRGPGLNYDLSPLQAQARTQDIQPPVVGDHLAIAILRMEQNVLPYLHREEASGPNGEKLNQMQTDLDMGGNNIIRAGEVRADKVISDIITADRLVVTGSCEGCDLSPPDTAGETTP